MDQNAASTSKNTDELKEITDAALILLSLKHTKLDPETAFQLESMKRSTVAHHTPRPHPPISIPDHQIPSRQNRFLRPPNHHQQNRQREKKQEHHLPASSMVESLQDIVGQQGGSVKKDLTERDLNSDLECLYLNKEKTKSNFESFFSKEEELIYAKLGKIKVTVYDSQGRGYEMYYKKWKKYNLPALSGYQWCNFCKDHELTIADVVTLSIFRHAYTHQLCFFCSVPWTAPIAA